MGSSIQKKPIAEAEDIESLKKKPRNLQMLRDELERARRHRLEDLGVSQAAIEKSELLLEKGESDPNVIRVMNFNLLADAMSTDGFLVSPVLKDWPAGHGRVPVADGGSVEMQHMLQEMLAAQGNKDALQKLKDKYDVPAARRNLGAVVDWEARELQIQLQVLALRPDIVIFEEVDHYGSLAKGLAKLGYSSRMPDIDVASYKPAHLSGQDNRGEENLDRLRSHIQSQGHAFLPTLGSTTMKLKLSEPELTSKILAAAEALDLSSHVADKKIPGCLSRSALVGLKGGSEPLLQKAGFKDPAWFDDDGVAIFWRSDRFEAEQLLPHTFSSGKGGVLEVHLRELPGCGGSGRSVRVMGAHLASGSSPSDEAKRLESEVHITPGLSEWATSARKEAAAQGAAFILALDANSHPQLLAPDSKSVWRTLHRVAGASVWDPFFNAEGKALDDGLGDAPVSTNKVRGPCSDQAKKIGQHAYYCIDHIFFGSLSLQGHAYPPKRFLSAEAALTEVLPSLTTPSDHYPLVADLAWASESTEHRSGISGA